MPFDIKAIGPTRDALGEGPFWDGARGELVRIDQENGLVLRLDPVSELETSMHLGAGLGFAVPTDTGELLVARGQDLFVVAADGSSRPFGALDPSEDPGRFNDGKCDSGGRLFTGTLDPAFQSVCSLYEVLRDGGLSRVTDGVALSNGLAWDDERGLMYYVDSVTQRIDVFDYDPGSGKPTGRRPFASIPSEEGLPDGMEVDAEGGIWIVLFYAGEVRRYAPDGSVSARIPVPTHCPTSIAFGGPDLRTAFVTSSKSWLTDEQRATEELGGAVLTFDAEVAGRPAGVFALNGS